MNIVKEESEFQVNSQRIIYIGRRNLQFFKKNVCFCVRTSVRNCFALLLLASRWIKWTIYVFWHYKLCFLFWKWVCMKQYPQQDYTYHICHLYPQEICHGMVGVRTTSYTITYKSRLTQKKLYKNTDAIFSIYGRNGINPWHFFWILT